MMREFLKYPRHIIAGAAFLFVALAIAMSSCISEYPSVPDGGCNDNTATLRIFMRLDSRSSEDSGFEDGVDFENFVDIDNDNYGIYFFRSDDNTFIDVFESVIHPSLMKENNGSDSGLAFNGYLYPEIGAKFKIVILANWAAYPTILEAGASVGSDEFALIKGKTTIKDLTTHIGSQFDALRTPDDGVSWLGKNRLMPFYGVRSFDLTATHPGSVDEQDRVLPGKMIDLKDYAVPMIRAMAKVEVLFDNPYAYFEEVEMSSICSKGFAAPYVSRDSWKYDWSDYWSPYGGWESNYVKGVHVVESEETRPSLRFTKVCDRSVGQDGSVVPEKWVAYMPEYKNIGVDDPTSIRVKLPSSVVGVAGDGQWRELLFTSDGESGDPFDIERNNIYRFKVGMDAVDVDIQPFTEVKLSFQFGLMRDERGDLMVLPIPKRDEHGNIVIDENGNPVMTYPQYFLNFINDDNPNHKYPKVCNENGEENPDGELVKLEEGDYYAIIVGEDEAMSNAVIWVKDRNGCHVLSNFGSADDSQECNARLVESFFGNNQSEKFYKDIFGYRRVHHFDNHNSIVIHPENNKMLFCMIENFQQENQTRKYYEVESWDGDSNSGWIINKDDAGNELGFQKITSDGLLGETVDLHGNSLTTDD